MSNVTVEAWRAWAKADTKPDAAIVQAAIDAAEETVNEHCGREFVVAHATNTSARLFIPRGDDVLRIDDAVAVTSITVDGAAYASTLWQLEPVNSRTASGQAVPYDQARLLGGLSWPTDYDKANISVVARWGWTALPDRYTNAVLMMTKDLVDMAEIRGGVLGFNDFGPVRVRDNPVVSMLLSRLRRVESWGIA